MTDILIVEDQKELAELLEDFLKKAGYQTVWCKSAEEALKYMREEEVRLFLLDIMLPGMDGFDFCKKVRDSKDVPILILSARDTKEDKLKGLLLGADDYIEKPYDIDILLAKIQGIFKRRYEKRVICDGDLKLDPDKRQVFLSDKELSLTIKEFELLYLLMQNKGTALKKEYLFGKIWGMDSFSEMQTLTVHIKWLREKIEKDPSHPRRIQTVWGVGYRYEAV